MQLNTKQQYIVNIVTKVLEGKLSTKIARKALNVSEKTMYRYTKKMRDKGISFIIHGNKGRIPANKISEILEARIIQLMKEKYFDFNFNHATEKLEIEEDIIINSNTLRRICHEHGIGKHKRKSKNRVYKTRPRSPQRGLMLQMDGSTHKWFGGRKSCLVTAIDDATNEIPYGEFFDSESTFSCMTVLKNIIKKVGIPEILYVDLAGIYGGQKRQFFSNFKRSAESLGITIIFAQSAQAKGRIERLFKTLQDRLIPAMRIAGVFNFCEANLYFNNVFLPLEYNNRFTFHPESPISAYREISNTFNLDQFFYIQQDRIIGNGHSFTLDNEVFTIAEDLDFPIAKKRALIRTYLDGSWKVFCQGREYKFNRYLKSKHVA